MAKRALDTPGIEYGVGHKRLKSSTSRLPDCSRTQDRLSHLPDELIIRVLSFLSEIELLRCHLLSRQYYRLCEDNDLWKAHYYDKFVRPRLGRLKSIQNSNRINRLTRYSRHANWLEDAYLLQPTNQTDWKRQFRLRYNWTNGRCNVHEIVIDQEQGDVPPLAQLHGGHLYTVDERAGLRVWNTKKQQDLIANVSLKDAGVPSALAIDGHSATTNIRILVGFWNGKVIAFTFQSDTGQLSEDVIIEDEQEQVTCMRLVWPFVLLMSKSRNMSLYQVNAERSEGRVTDYEITSYKLLHRLQSRIDRVPLSMSLRVIDSTTMLSIAFATHNAFGTSRIGIQEVQISHRSGTASSRLYYAHDETNPSINSSPTSVSYNHPYLLVSNAYNTLTLYLVQSDSKSLSISSGNQLWGHTSAVSYAHVGSRGRAVSVSKIGGELRVWELEGSMVSNSIWKRFEAGEMSVRVRPRSQIHGIERELKANVWANGPSSGALENIGKFRADVDVATKRRWVGFDEENVAVLQESRDGRHNLVIYNFA